jgi:hypothetical protein
MLMSEKLVFKLWIYFIEILIIKYHFENLNEVAGYMKD